MTPNNRNLSAHRLRELFDYCPHTGSFVRAISAGNALAGSSPRTINKNGYIRIYVDGAPYFAHRLAWLYMTGSFPEKYIDHKDQNRSNNSFSNLREATHSKNNKNASMRIDNISGCSGIDRRAGKYRARITSNKKEIFLGEYENLFDAVCARKSAEIKHGFSVNHGSA